MSLREYIEALPITENHAHPVKPLPEETTTEEFASYFAEGPASEHARTTMLYRAELTLLEERFEGTTEQELIRNRLDVDLKQYTRTLTDQSGIRAIVTDTGYPPGVSAADFREYTGAEVHPVLRIENVIEDLIRENDQFEELIAAYETRLQGALEGEFVGFKSIVAYRSGLEVTAPDRAATVEAFREVKQNWAGRIEHPVLLNYLIERAADIAADYGAPIQFHTGFGDNDAHPMEIDPGLLWDFMKRHPTVDTVLLHMGYPHVRKSAYIASVLENAHVDIGMTIPFAQHGSERLLRELFELAPTSKLLYSSDSLVVPEWYYLGATRCRDALSTVLEDFVDREFLDGAQARSVAEGILYRNAEQLYGIEPE